MRKVIFKNEFTKEEFLPISWFKKFEIENVANIKFSYINEETIIEVPDTKEIIVEYQLIENSISEDEQYIDDYWRAKFEIKRNRLILKEILEFNGYKEQEINKLDNSVLKKMKKQIEEDMVYRIE